jgi:hypothetical protein
MGEIKMIEIKVMLFALLAICGITLFKMIEYVTELRYKIERLEKIVVAVNPGKEVKRLNMRERHRFESKGQLIPFLADIKKKNTVFRKNNGDDDNGKSS